jgi:AcrR family transcriptional regulator
MQVTSRQRDFLEAAAAIAAKEGLGKLTIRNVASAVGVTEPAVYRHFAHKRALLEAILTDLQERIRPHFYLLHPQKGEAEQLEYLFDDFFNGLFGELDSKPAYAVFIFSEELFHTEPQLKSQVSEIMGENLQAICQFVAELQQKGFMRKDLSALELAEIVMGKIRLEITKWHLSESSYPLSGRSSACAQAIARLFTGGPMG